MLFSQCVSIYVKFYISYTYILLRFNFERPLEPRGYRSREEIPWSVREILPIPFLLCIFWLSLALEYVPSPGWTRLCYDATITWRRMDSPWTRLLFKWAWWVVFFSSEPLSRSMHVRKHINIFAFFSNIQMTWLKYFLVEYKSPLIMHYQLNHCMSFGPVVKITCMYKLYLSIEIYRLQNLSHFIQISMC